MLRLVRVGDEVVDGTVPRLPGRGAYLHPKRSCLDVALKRRVLRRVFGAAVNPSPALAEHLGEICSGWKQGASGE